MLARIRKSMQERDQGFTLIELLVVMIIIGILAAIAIPVFLNQQIKAAESAAKADAHNAYMEIAAAQVDKPVTGVTVAGGEATSKEATLTFTPADLTPAKVKKTEGVVLSVAQIGTTGTWCVSANPDAIKDGASPWSVGPNGLVKGVTCS